MNLKKIKILVIFLISFSNSAFSDNYQKTSPYWSTEKNGPRSLDEAIDMFFKDRPLDPLEGIWTESNWGLVAITKSGNNYHKYVISVDYSGLNGTHETTYLKTADENVFTFFTRISWRDGNWFKFRTSPGTLVLNNQNFGERIIDKYAMYPNGTLIRNWPTDLYAYNQKFSETSSVQSVGKSDKTKKFYNLNWKNLDIPTHHDAEIPNANATVSIIDSEIYLTDKKDINQLGLILFNDPDPYNNMVIIDEESYDYSIYIEYIDDGYVSIDEWKNLDPKILLEEMKSNKREDIRDIKWVFDPKIYDEKHVTYSYEIQWENGTKSLETKSLALGRNGYLDIAFVSKVTKGINFKDHADMAIEFANSVVFDEGFKHSDYKSGDKVAALGIGGLVAGTLGVKTFAKAGVFAKFLPLLAKFWWIILAPIAAIGFLTNKKSKTNIPEHSPTQNKSIKKRITRRKKSD
tara:strand:- start:7076 stop:8458 length:1383 start_codon:yes stop_codon:yes gene_type:complete